MPNTHLDGQRARLIKDLAMAYSEVVDGNATREGRIARIWRELLAVQAQVDALALHGAEAAAEQFELER